MLRAGTSRSSGAAQGGSKTIQTRHGSIRTTGELSRTGRAFGTSASSGTQTNTRTTPQVNLLYTERNDLESSLAKLQAEHDCLMISSQNSVSFHYHSQAMLEVKRLLEELKNKYHNDKESLLLRIETSEQERDSFKVRSRKFWLSIRSIEISRCRSGHSSSKFSDSTQ